MLLSNCTDSDMLLLVEVCVSYRVEHIRDAGDSLQHVVVDGGGHLAVLPCRFLKHLRVVGKSSNTQKAYAYALKEYSIFLEQIGLEYVQADKRTLTSFVAWLQDPTVGTKVVNLAPGKPSRAASTVNNYIAAVLSFYKYLFEVDLFQIDLWGPAGKTGSPEKSAFKPFLHKLAYQHKGSGFSLYVKESKRRVQKLTKDQVETVLVATTNPRDKLLVYLMYITGLRVGEVLSLHEEDFVFDLRGGHRVELHDRGELVNGAELKCGERVVHIDQHCMDLLDDYEYYALDKVDKDTDFVFVTLRGKNIGRPMNYSDVSAVFRRLRAKTGLKTLHPHILRHTHASLYYKSTKDPEALRDRLGHANVQTSIDMYVHMDEGELYEEWSNAEEAFRLEVNNG